MKLLLTFSFAIFVTAAGFGAPPAAPREPKPVGMVAAVVVDSSVSREGQVQIERLLKSQRIEPGRPVDSHQFLTAAALVNELTGGAYSAVWRRPAGSEELTLYIGKAR